MYRNTGITISDDVAVLVVQVIDALDAVGRKGGGVLGREVAKLRNELAECVSTRVDTRVGVSAEVPAALAVLALDVNAVVDTKTAARRLNMTADGVRWHCRRGTLERTKIQGRWWITTASIDEFENERMTK